MTKQKPHEVLKGRNGKGLKIAVVVSLFNREYTKALEVAGLKALRDAQVSQKDILLVHVPGALELPFAAVRLMQKKLDAIICYGVVIRGDTDHYMAVFSGVERGLTLLNTQGKVPVLQGVIFAHDIAQVEERIKNDKTNLGYYTALAAVEIAHVTKTVL